MKTTNNIDLNAFRPMIYSIISRCEPLGGYSDSYEDLFQEACIALCEAYKSYESDKNTKFSSYAYLLIRRRILKKARESVRLKKYEPLSLDAIHDGEFLQLYGINFDANTSRQEINASIRLLSNDFLNKLCELDKTIIQLRKEAATYDEIASSTGLTVKQVDNRLYKIRKMYREFVKQFN